MGAGWLFPIASLLFLSLLWWFFWPKWGKKAAQEKGGIKSKLVVSGMHCTGCALNIENTLKDVEGVGKVSVNYSTGLADVLYDPNELSMGDIIKKVENIGYEARIAVDQSQALTKARESKQRDVTDLRNALLLGLPFSIFVVAGTMLAMWIEFPPWFVWTLVAGSLPVIFWTGSHFFVGTYKMALARQTDMNTLVALGVGASFVFSILTVLFPNLGKGALYLDGAVVIVMLVLLGNYLRGRAELLAMREIFDVAALLPEKAHRLLQDGTIEDTPVRYLKEGDLIAIRATERAPADCVVTKGTSEFNNAHITGESMPVAVSPGDKVYAGAINSYGLVEAKCEKVGESTVLSRVIELIAAAIQTKPKVQALVDRVASVFVPSSITIAIVSFNVWFLLGLPNVGINTAISVLVISCPCALGLATPTSISIALGIAAKSGLLIKDAMALESLQDVKVFVFDKTGTLTLGAPKVTTVHAANEEELVWLAATAETGSEHTLAKAVLEYADLRGIKYSHPDSFEAMPGLGLKATIEGHEVLVGGPRLIEVKELNLNLGLLGGFSPEEAVFYVVKDGKVLGGFGLSDPLRPEAKEAITRLVSLGVTPVLVSGDRKEVCEAIADKLGIKRVYAQVLPEEKVQIVKILREDGPVAMMGDGVNDAAALAAADASFAPKSGTGMALDVADVTVMREDLLLVPMAVRLAKATRKNILWNLFWAFAYNTLAIPVAAGALFGLGVMLDPMIASAAMAASSITVVMNSLRLKLFKQQL